MQHIVLFIPGLGDDVHFLRAMTAHWKQYNLIPMFHSMRWRDQTSSFIDSLETLSQRIDKLTAQKNVVSLIGTSAGGSAVINAYIQRKQNIHKIVTICSRLSIGPTNGYRSFLSKTKTSPAFADSIRMLETMKHTLNMSDLKHIMTISAKFGDELVPYETSILHGANNRTIPTIEHMLSIGLALTLFSKQLIHFLTSRHDC